MRSLFFLALNDLRLLWRDKMAIFWALGFPFLFAIFFGNIFSGGGSMRQIGLAVVDQDNSELSQSFVDRLNKSESFTVYHTTRDSALTMVRKGNQSAFIVLKNGFGEQTLFAPGNENYIELGIDPSHTMTSGLIEGLITRTMFQVYVDMMQNPAQMRPRLTEHLNQIRADTTMAPYEQNTLTEFFGSLDQFYGRLDSMLTDSTPADTSPTGDELGSVMQVNIDHTEVTTQRDGPLSAFEVLFPSAIFWGLLACAATFATTIVRERTAGTYHRLRVAPLTPMHILVGKGLACFVACLLVSALLLVVGNLIFDVRVANVPLLILAILASAFCFVGIMMVLSVLGRTEASVSGGGWAVLLVLAMFGGGMIPLIFMPSWMKPLSSFSPIKWGIVAIEGAVWRDFSFPEMLTPVGILIAVGLAAFIIGKVIFTRRDY
jgi:ABC-2 type transport system permease protein